MRVSQRLLNLSDKKKEIVKRNAMQAYADAIRATPVRTGTLQAGWSVSIEESKNMTVVSIENTVPYAMYVEMGTSKMRGKEMLGIRTGKIYSKLMKGVING